MPMELLPLAKMLGWMEGHISALSPFGRSMAQAEEVWDNSCSQWAVQTHRDVLLGGCITAMHNTEEVQDAVLNPLVSLCHLETNKH